METHTFHLEIFTKNLYLFKSPLLTSAHINSFII